MDVLARIAGQGDAFRVAGQVVLLARPAPAQQEPGRIVPTVEVGIADRPLAVQDLQIEPCAADVPEQLRVVVARQRRAVGREVVGQVLAEHRPPGGDGAGVRRAAVRAVAEPTGPADGRHHLRLDRQRRQLREQAHVAAGRQGCVAGPRRCQAVVAHLPHGAASLVTRALPRDQSMHADTKKPAPKRGGIPFTSAPATGQLAPGRFDVIHHQLQARRDPGTEADRARRPKRGKVHRPDALAEEKAGVQPPPPTAEMRSKRASSSEALPPRQDGRHYARSSGGPTASVKSPILVDNPTPASRSRVAFGHSSRPRSKPALPRADHLVRHRLGWPHKQGAKRPERRLLACPAACRQ